MTVVVLSVRAIRQELDYGNSSHGHQCCQCGDPLPQLEPGTWDANPLLSYVALAHGLPRGTGMELLHLDVWAAGDYFDHRGVQVCSEGCAIRFVAWVQQGPAPGALCPAHYAQ